VGPFYAPGGKEKEVSAMPGRVQQGEKKKKDASAIVHRDRVKKGGGKKEVASSPSEPGRERKKKAAEELCSGPREKGKKKGRKTPPRGRRSGLVRRKDELLVGKRRREKTPGPHTESVFLLPGQRRGGGGAFVSRRKNSSTRPREKRTSFLHGVKKKEEID